MTKELTIRTRKLTLKEQRFIKYYLETGNPSYAAKKAYQIGSRNGQLKYRDQTASEVGREVLERPLVKAEIDKAIVKEKITPHSVLKRIDNLADNAQQDRDKLTALKMLGQNQNIFAEDNKKITDYNITIQLGTADNKIIEGEVES